MKDLDGDLTAKEITLFKIMSMKTAAQIKTDLKAPPLWQKD